MATTFDKTGRNLGRATLASTLTIGGTTMTTTAGGAAALSAETRFKCKLWDGDDPEVFEIVLVTAVSGEAHTVTRGQESSTAREWPSGTVVDAVITTGQIDQIQDAVSAIETTGAVDALAVSGAATIGGGYGSTGVTISAAGNIQANGTLTVDGASTLTGEVQIGGGYGSTGVTVTTAGNVSANGTLTVDGLSTLAGLTIASGRFQLTEPSTATISAGTVAATGPMLYLDTEGAAASDDLDTVTGMSFPGAIIWLQTVNDARDVVVKHSPGTTNGFRLEGAENFTLTTKNSVLCCKRRDGVWCEQYRKTL